MLERDGVEGRTLTWDVVHLVEEDDLVDCYGVSAGPLFHDASHHESAVGFQSGLVVDMRGPKLVAGVTAGALLEDFGTAWVGVEVACRGSVGSHLREKKVSYAQSHTRPR